MKLANNIKNYTKRISDTPFRPEQALVTLRPDTETRNSQQLFQEFPQTHLLKAARAPVDGVGDYPAASKPAWRRGEQTRANGSKTGASEAMPMLIGQRKKDRRWSFITIVACRSGQALFPSQALNSRVDRLASWCGVPSRPHLARDARPEVSSHILPSLSQVCCGFELKLGFLHSRGHAIHHLSFSLTSIMYKIPHVS